MKTYVGIPRYQLPPISFKSIRFYLETDVRTLTNTGVGMDSSIEKNSQQDMIEKKDQR